MHPRPLITAGKGVGSTSKGTTANLRSATVGEACASTWLDAYTTMDALGGKLVATAAAVVSADENAADLYRGPKADLPPLTIDLGGE